jgi:hypothetical protein
MGMGMSKCCLASLLTALGILGAIALAGLGLGIYAAIALTNQTSSSQSSTTNNNYAAGKEEVFMMSESRDHLRICSERFMPWRED